MSLLDTAQQLINGALYDYSAIEIAIGVRMFNRVTSINYEHGVEQGELRGNSPFLIGTTRGIYTATGSMTLYKEEFDALTTMLMGMPGPGSAPAGGWMEKRFPIIVTFAEPSSGKLITDQLEGVRILRSRDNYSAGADALMTECDLHISKVVLNGKYAVLDNTFKP